jgi:hypothetical protein
MNAWFLLVIREPGPAAPSAARSSGVRGLRRSFLGGRFPSRLSLLVDRNRQLVLISSAVGHLSGSPYCHSLRWGFIDDVNDLAGKVARHAARGKDSEPSRSGRQLGF